MQPPRVRKWVSGRRKVALGLEDLEGRALMSALTPIGNNPPPGSGPSIVVPPPGTMPPSPYPPGPPPLTPSN